MPIVYLEPSDLSLVQAATVLEFLNRASSAEQLGRDIEFPDEPDIGVRLGQRLLDARAALGGRYTDIRQVRAVRLIGPERFTEICVGALGLDPRRWVDLFFGGAPMGSRGEEGLVLSLDVPPRSVWLGLPRTLFATVRSKSGEPRAGVAVTLQTDVGRLSHAYGFSVSEGAAVTAITGADGRAELRLLTPPDEPLSAEQEAALHVALNKLDAEAAHPLAIENALLALAGEYQLDLNHSLRGAIDLYLRQQRAQSVDSLAPGRWRLAWPLQRGVVRADAHPAEGGGTSLTHAVLTLAWKNWLPPWVEFMTDRLRNQAKLDAAFAAASGDDLVNSLVGSAHGFLAAQPGLGGEWIAKRVIDVAVRDYIDKEVAKLPEAQRAGVIAHLDVGASAMKPGNLGVYQVVDRSKPDFGGKLSGINAGVLEQLGNLRAIEANVNAKATAVDAAAARVFERADQADTRLTRFDSQFSQFQTDFATFDRNRGQFGTDIAAIRLDLDAIRPRGRAGPPAVAAKAAPAAPAGPAPQPGSPPAAAPRKRRPRPPEGG